jgi:hypothetical protein
MQYWKRIHLEHFETIQRKTLELIKQHSGILDRRNFRGSFIPFPDAEFMEKVPEINQSFAPYGRRCIKSSIYLMWNNTDALPHVDGAESIARVNIPILNCEGTNTVFYENIVTRPLRLPTGVVYEPVINHDYREVTRVEISSPTIIRVREGHSVVMNEARSPRITLTMQLDPDIVDLLED